MNNKSPIGYAGGKSYAVEHLAPHMPECDTMMSPFCGGGSFELYNAGQGISVTGYDTYEPLACYWHFQIHYREELFDAVENLVPISRELFDWLHENVDQMEHSIEQAAGYFVLNMTSYLSMGQSAGKSFRQDRFHCGTPARILKFDPENFDVHCMDFRESIPRHPCDFLYLDPPYDLPSGRDDMYGNKGSHHRDFDHEALFELVKDRPNWMMSHSRSTLIEEMYQDFPMHEISYFYPSSKKIGTELLIQSRIQ